MTDKQLQNQLNTWKKHNPEIYNDIKLLGYEMGVIGKSGKVLKYANKKRNIDFKNIFNKRYGAYTNFKKRVNAEYKKEPKEFKKQFTKNDFIKLKSTLHELWVVLWKTVDSKIAREVTVTAENMDIENKIKLIERVLNSNDVNEINDIKNVKIDIDREEFEELL